MAKRQARVVPTPSDRTPSSREELEARRNGVVAPGPSGAIYRVRPINLETYTLAGGLPERLRQIALQGVKGINQLFKADEQQLSEHGLATKEWLDRLVQAVILEPKLELEDLGTGRLDDFPLLPPPDYKWALAIAMGDEDRDGEGRLLWGVEPESRWDAFREEHECPDWRECEGCVRLQQRYSAVLANA